METTSAYWIENDLFIDWYGIRNKFPAAKWYPKGTANGGELEFIGISETGNWILLEKPSAEKALEKIINWQQG